MKKFAFYLFAAVAVAAVAACQKQPEEQPEDKPVEITYDLQADASFVDMKAVVKLEASSAPKENVECTMLLDATSTFPEGSLNFPPAFTIPAGTKGVDLEVTIRENAPLAPAQTYTAVFGVEIAGKALDKKVSITYNSESLEGAWSVIGQVNGSNWDADVVMTKGEDGWYSAADVALEAGAAFKFRRDADWKLSYGLPKGSPAPALDVEFDVSTEGGEGTDILVEAEGYYTLSLNPNAAKAKIQKTADFQYETVVERAWGKYPPEWATLNSNKDRNAAMDDEYVYVVKAGGDVKGIVGYSITDPSKTVQVKTDAIIDEGTFATSCVKTILDPATGKKILLVCNLAMTKGAHLYLYAYDKGIDQDPTVLLSDYTLPSWADRRFGDFFTVVGDWSKGAVWFRTFTEGAATTARFNIENGALKSQTPDGFNYGGDATKGKKAAFYQFGMSETSGLLITTDLGLFYDLNSADSKPWATLDHSVFKNHFGFTLFEFDGEKYMAFTKMYNAARAWLTIIKSTGNHQDDLETYAKEGGVNIVYQGAIQIAEDGPSTNVMEGATYTDQSTGSCDVVVKEDAAYIMGHLHNTGLSVFKMYKKRVEAAVAE